MYKHNVLQWFFHGDGPGPPLTWVSLDETDSLSSGRDGVKLAEIGVPGMPLAWTCSLSLPSVPSSSSELWVPSVTLSADSDSAGSASPLGSLVSEHRWAGSRQCPVAEMGVRMSWVDRVGTQISRNRYVPAFLSLCGFVKGLTSCYTRYVQHECW